MISLDVRQTTCNIIVQYNNVHAHGIRDELRYEEPGETIKVGVYIVHVSRG